MFFLKCKNKTLFYLKKKKQHLHEVNIVYFKLYHAHIFKVIVICLYSQKLCFVYFETRKDYNSVSKFFNYVHVAMPQQQ